MTKQFEHVSCSLAVSKTVAKLAVIAKMLSLGRIWDVANSPSPLSGVCLDSARGSLQAILPVLTMLGLRNDGNGLSPITLPSFLFSALPPFSSLSTP